MSLPPRAVTRARLALRRELADLGPGSTIAVACSGGADSLALVTELTFLARRQGWRTAAFLIDHAMQAGSAEVTHRAARTCERLGVDIVRTQRVEVASGPASGGPENAARDARYEALDRLAQEENASAVLLGHTIDDQAETMLLGLHRGSGTRSLAGMRRRKGVFRRPYLELSRADTEAICAHSQIDFWVDPTNLQTGQDAPLRSQVRGRLIPLLDSILGPKIAQTLARTATQLQEDADALDQYASELYERAVLDATVVPASELAGTPAESSKSKNAMDLTLSVSELFNAPRAVRTRALRRAVIAAGSPAGPLKFSHIEELEKLITQWRGQKSIGLPNAFTAWRESGTIRIAPPSLESGPRKAPRTPARAREMAPTKTSKHDTRN